MSVLEVKILKYQLSYHIESPNGSTFKLVGSQVTLESQYDWKYDEKAYHFYKFSNDGVVSIAASPESVNILSTHPLKIIEDTITTEF